MTDAELIVLVQSKSPEELTPEETGELRKHLAESEELRRALFETLQMESYLAAALGPINLRPEQIVARAAMARNDQVKAWMWIAGGLGCLLFLVVGFAAIRAALNTGETTVVQVPEKKTEPPVEPEPEPAAEEKVEPAEVPSEPMPMPVAETPMVEPVPMKTEPEVAKVEPPVVEPPKVEPWSAVLNMPAEKLPSFAQVSFEDFPYQRVLPLREDVNQWFEAVAGRNYRVQDGTSTKGKAARLEGFARLRAPLPADGGIRIAMEDYNRLAIHAWHGNQGVMLMYFVELRDRWVAYQTTRKEGESQLETLAIVGTDDDRTRRAEIRFGGPLELRYREGELLLIRGDVVLVSAPLSGPPDDIYFDGKATFTGLSLVRTKDLTVQPEVEPQGAKLRPADLAWEQKVSEGAKFEKLEDGSVKITSKEPKEPSYVFAPIPGVGYREVVFELDQVSPGAGVYLGYADQTARQIIRVTKNTRSGRLNAMLRPPDDFFEGDFPPLAERPEYAVGSKMWVRLLHGNGCLKWWVSPDGTHWAIGDVIPEDTLGQIVSLGLTTCRTKEESSAVLRSVAVRELPAINSLAPRELVEKAPATSKANSLEAWHAEAVATCPAGVELKDWRRAYAVRTLGGGMPHLVAAKVLEGLLDDSAMLALPPQQQIDVLREVLLVETDPRDAGSLARGVLSRLHAAGRLAAAQGGLPFSSVRKVLMQAPTWSQQQLPVTANGEAEEELIRLLQQGRTAEALALCQLLKLYHFHENRPMFAWAEAAARRDSGRVTGEGARAKEAWRQPLVEELNKEVYNFASDLHAIVESGAMEDASRMIASLEADRGSGLTPSGSDRDLFVSLSGAVKLAIAQQPALRAELNKKLAPLAQLRIRQAIASGDESAITLAAAQFEGTEAASEAYRWLGDRALQNGWFARALAEYRRAETTAAASLTRDLGPRARLAAAMMGVDHGTAVTQPVNFGDHRMAPAEFETLVAEMKARGTGTLLGATPAPPVTNLPGPAQIQAQNRARLDGPVGQNPHDDGAPRISQYQIDYAGRQIATKVDGDVLYLSNRFQIAAYNATSGQRMWQSETPAGEMRRGQEWPLAPMHPLVTSNAIFARQLYGKSPTIACFEKAGGKKLWQRDGTDQMWWVSDPVFVQGQLLALALLRETNRESQLQLVSLDPLTGEMLVQRRLIGLRESWQHRKVCEVTALEDGIVAVLGGVTLCCDASGSVRWVRKSLVMPHEERPEWVLQYFQRPLVVDNRVIAVQPGVESLDCLDVVTGRRLWTYSEDRAWRVLGRSGDRVIVESANSVAAINLQDGQVAWRRSQSEPTLTAGAVSDKYVLLVNRRTVTDKLKMPSLTWLDANDGRFLGSFELPQWQTSDPRIGPIVATKDRLWTFFSNEKDPNKDLVELTPGMALAAAVERVVTPWQRSVPAPLTETLGELAPQWQVVSGYQRAGVEKKASWQGESDAALILARPDLPAMLGSEFTLPAGKQPKLNLRLGHEGAQPGQFSVRVDGDVLLTQEWKADNANRWDNLSLDLAKYAGRKVLISMAYAPTAADHGWWIKSAQLAME